MSFRRIVDGAGGPVMAPAVLIGVALGLWALLDFASLTPWGVRNPHGAGIEVVSLRELEQVIAQPGPPLVVNYWTTWCAPCRAFTPVFRDAAPQYAGRTRFLKVEVTDEDFARERFGVAAVPAVVVYAGGGRVAEMREFGAGGLAAAVDEGLRSVP